MTSSKGEPTSATNRQVLEFQAHQRLWALEQDVVSSAAASGMQDQAAAQQAAVEAEARRKMAGAWLGRGLRWVALRSVKRLS